MTKDTDEVDNSGTRIANIADKLYNKTNAI